MATRDYVIRLPRDTQVLAACEDVGCDQQRFGWETVADETDRLQATVAMTIRSGQTGRTFREMADVRDGKRVAVFRFDAGQRCFAEHRTRPAQFIIRPGGGQPPIRHTRLADWGEDLVDHGGRLADQARKG